MNPFAQFKVPWLLGRYGSTRGPPTYWVRAPKHGKQYWNNQLLRIGHGLCGVLGEESLLKREPNHLRHALFRSKIDAGPPPTQGSPRAANLANPCGFSITKNDASFHLETSEGGFRMNVRKREGSRSCTPRCVPRSRYESRSRLIDSPWLAATRILAPTPQESESQNGTCASRSELYRFHQICPIRTSTRHSRVVSAGTDGPPLQPKKTIVDRRSTIVDQMR